MYEASGALSRLNVAFSRDSQEKVYVQHHLERDAGARLSPTLCVAQKPGTVVRTVITCVSKLLL